MDEKRILQEIEEMARRCRVRNPGCTKPSGNAQCSICRESARREAMSRWMGVSATEATYRAESNPETGDEERINDELGFVPVVSRSAYRLYKFNIVLPKGTIVKRSNGSSELLSEDAHAEFEIIERDKCSETKKTLHPYASEGLGQL